jgi:NADPH-dependent glutamate synthase beta subunit-like oxidoreductase/ferredoxin
MVIPAMIRAIAQADLAGAIRVVKSTIAMPAVASRLCNAPCQKACRRGRLDEPVAICLLKRLVAELDLHAPSPFAPTPEAPRSARVAVVGAGPAGLACAYYLAWAGISVTVFDDRSEPGGTLRDVGEKFLPRGLLDAEIRTILDTGLQMQMGIRVGKDIPLRTLRSQFNAVVLAIGATAGQQASQLGLSAGADGLSVDSQTYQTDLPGVFAAGDAVRPRRMVSRALAEGRAIAHCVRQYVQGMPIQGIRMPFNSHIGQVDRGVLDQMILLASKDRQVRPVEEQVGFSLAEGRQEAARCLHCDCRKAQSCGLRRLADLYQARQSRFKGSRRAFALVLDHPDLIYEPGKCISCGICVRLTRLYQERYGLTFIGRGFQMGLGVPFGKGLAEGIERCAAHCVRACPTGALAWR